MMKNGEKIYSPELLPSIAWSVSFPNQDKADYNANIYTPFRCDISGIHIRFRHLLRPN